MSRSCRTKFALALAIAGLLGASALIAATPVAGLDGSPDVTISLSGVPLSDDVIGLGLAGTPSPAALGLPPEASVDAFDVAPDGRALFAVGAPIELGGTTYFPFDVVRWDGSTYSKFFDGAAHGIPAGVKIDALTVDSSALLLSFDVGVMLSGTYFADEDLARWDGVSFSQAFDGSAAGVDPALDLDAAHRLANGHLLLSFDDSGEVAGVAFADEDVLEYDPATGVWELAFDGSAANSAWVTADLDALSAGERVVAIPTLTPVGLLALALFLLGCGLVSLRRAA